MGQPPAIPNDLPLPSPHGAHAMHGFMGGWVVLYGTRCWHGTPQCNRRASWLLYIGIPPPFPSALPLHFHCTPPSMSTSIYFPFRLLARSIFLCWALPAPAISNRCSFRLIQPAGFLNPVSAREEALSLFLCMFRTAIIPR